MSEINFSLNPETSKPTRKYRKGSKYDPILKEFLKSPHELVKVEVPDKDANYIRTQLKKRLDAQGRTDIKISVVNDICYLEKAVPTEKPKKEKGIRSTPTPEPEPESEPEPETPV